MHSKSATASNWAISPSQRIGCDPLLDCLVILTEHFGTPCSADALAAGLPVIEASLPPELLPQAASRAGLTAKLNRKGLDELPDMLLPCILLLKDHKACVLQELDLEKNRATISLPETGGQEVLTVEELELQYIGYLFLIKQQYRGDKHVSLDLYESKEHWLWRAIRDGMPIYRDVIIATILINLFALVSPLFVMNVYDKVVPNLAFESLWVLAIGASIAYIFDLILKQLRGYLVDVAGKKIDITMSAKLFSKVIGMPLENRSPSVGATAKQVSEFDSIRDFLSSATITAVVDLPFALFFMFIIWFVAGDLVMFPIIATILIIGYTLVLQPRLKHAIEESNKFASLRHAHLIESLNSIESIKANGAEGIVQKAWQQMLGHTSHWNMKSKNLSNSSSNFASFIVQAAVIGVIVLGVYRVSENLISMGAIIASVMLSSRAISPMAKIAGLLTRSNHTVSAMNSIDKIMNQEGEFENKGQLISISRLKGQIDAEQLTFNYPNIEKPALYPLNLKIKPGEKVGIIGRNGSGKTTLAKVLLSLYQPTGGTLRFDGIDHGQIHPNDLRRNYGYLPQEVVLFHGTIRDNILFGTRQVTEYQLMRAVQLSGVGLFTDMENDGMDLQVGEGGLALSRGQRQSIALARAILNDPPFLLLDEPTASLDARAETQFVRSMKLTGKDRTMILITHKMQILNLVDRVIVLDRGRMIMDGPRDQVLEKLKAGNVEVRK